MKDFQEDQGLKSNAMILFLILNKQESFTKETNMEVHC